MKQLLQKTIDIRAGEWKRVLIMAGYNFVIIASYNVLKPMTRSLFVTEMGLQQLPFLYMLLAGVVGVFVVLYLRISNSIKLDKLVNITTVVLMLSLLFFWWLLSIDIKSAFLYYGLFIWASIYGVLTTTQYWLLANYVFNAREAKRLFPILTSSALTGAIMGGYFTRFLVKQIGGTANLAFFCMALLAAALLLMNLAWKNRDYSIDHSKSTRGIPQQSHSFKIITDVLKILKNSKHLALLISVVALTYMVVQIADFQFVAFASEEITNTDELTGFLGFWLSNLSIIALAFQLLFANSILKHFGVGATILFLPIALLITSTWVLLGYGLISVLAIKVGDGAFRHSINKVGLELLYLPIPNDIKKKAKAFIDIFADRFARGIAGLLLLIFFTILGISISHISIISIILISIWIALSLLTYREYVNSFRLAITKRQIDANSISVSIKDEATINSLMMSLASQNERQVIYALQLLQSVDAIDLEPALKPLLQHKSAEVRYNALNLIYIRQVHGLQNEVKSLLNDSDPAVSSEAVRIMAEFSEEPTAEILKKWLMSDNFQLSTATLRLVAEHPGYAKALLNREMIHTILKKDEQSREQIAIALGVLNDVSHFEFLSELLDDSDESVKIQAIKSAGKTGNPEFVPKLITNLGRGPYRGAARQALINYGDSIIYELNSALQNTGLTIQTRIDVTRILGAIGSQNSIDILLKNMNVNDELLRFRTIKALNKLRANYPELIFDKRIEYEINDELKKYFSTLVMCKTFKEPADDKTERPNLLQKILQERLDDHLERVFRLLGLRYPPRDIYNAFAATTSGNKATRANATEFLDNILSNNHKRLLLPIVEDLPAEEILKNANGSFEIQLTDKNDVLTQIVNSNDPLLQACAMYEIGVRSLTDDFKHQLKSAAKSENTLVKETANLVLKQFA